MSFESAPNHETPAEKKLNPWVKIALEMGPLLIFFVANARGEKMAASWPLIQALAARSSSPPPPSSSPRCWRSPFPTR